MKFWDTSAIIPLLVDEVLSSKVDRIFENDSSLVVWWGTSIECTSAICRLERETKLDPDDVERLLQRLSELRESWWEIQASQKVKEVAERLLRMHALRAQDAQQLAACILANSDNKMEFVCLDEKLLLAARREGLMVA